ncbi:MAG: hypothetical protein K2X01_11490 [Cyanobacteria bacterium]|nr:hypothetical protein [Cyanobacteriota bacterium]
MMRLIRRKDNPFVLKAFGYVESGGLGSFDPTLYEEVEGELPLGWEIEEFVSPMDKVKEIFNRAITEKPSVATPKVQKELLKLAGTVERAIGLGLYAAAREAINEPLLHPELEPYRTEMLKALPSIV